MSETKKKQIAIVDDEPSMTKLLKMIILESIDCEIETFNSPTEALACFKEKTYDLITLDHRMPDLTGMDIVKLLRTSSGPNSNSRIILLTGFRDEAECAHPDLLDEVVFFEKPINESRFIRWVRFLLAPKKGK